MMAGFLKSTVVSGFVALACVSAGPALANSFQGSIWSLSTNGIDLDANPLTQTFQVALAVDTSGYTGGGSFLDQAAIKVSSSLLNASLISAPGGLANWTYHPGGLNAADCNGTGSGFECVDSVTVAGGAAVPGGIYTWVLDLTMNNGALFTGALQDSVKGRFVNASGNKVGSLVSENATMNIVTTSAIPEPESYATLLAGLGLLGFMAGRRKRKEAA